MLYITIHAVDLHGKPVDMWSIGVICYIILGGYPPFHDENKKRLYALIRSADYEFHEDYWNNVSDEAKDLIKNLLLVDSRKRFTAKQALEHSWVSGFVSTVVMLWFFLHFCSVDILHTDQSCRY